MYSVILCKLFPGTAAKRGMTAAAVDLRERYRTDAAGWQQYALKT
jgi:hypothetical protein